MTGPEVRSEVVVVVVVVVVSTATMVISDLCGLEVNAE